MKTYKAITIRQPWAQLIATGHKTVENRKKRTHYRGQILICSSAKVTLEDWLSWCDFSEDRALSYPLEGHPKDLKAGFVLAVADLADCVERASDLTAHDARWFTGPFGYVLRNVRPVNPHACKGQLGIFNLALPDGWLDTPVRPEPTEN